MGELLSCMTIPKIGDSPRSDCCINDTISTISNNVNTTGIGDIGIPGDMPDQKEIADRLRSIRLKRGYRSAAAASRAFGWTEVTYRAHENGTNPIDPETALKYCKSLRVNPGWLIFGDKFVTMTGKEVEPTDNDLLTDVAWRRIPVLNVKMLLPEKPLQYTLDQSSEFVVVPDEEDYGPLTFVKHVPDDSMLNVSSRDSFKPGEIIVFDGEKQVSPGDYVLVEMFNNGGCLFRQYRLGPKNEDGDQIIILTPINPFYPMEEFVDEKTGRILGRLIRHIRRY